jgi:hypothetical protein
MATIDESGFADFDRLLTLVRRTRELLDGALDAGELPDGGADFLADMTLPHLEDVQSGFRGWLRSEGVGLAELQYLLMQAAAARIEPPSTPSEREAAIAEASREAAGGRPTLALKLARTWDLAALAHARVVLACLPRVPEGSVRFPAGRRSYADIAAPHGPAELAERLAELERELWRMAIGRRPAVTDPAFRRTYGFFDAADRLGWKAFALPAA